MPVGVGLGVDVAVFVGVLVGVFDDAGVAVCAVVGDAVGNMVRVGTNVATGVDVAGLGWCECRNGCGSFFVGLTLIGGWTGVGRRVTGCGRGVGRRVTGPGVGVGRT